MSLTAPKRDLPPRRSTARILAPAILIGFVLLAYGVYWYVMGDRVRNEVEAWSARSAQEDVTGSWQSLKLRGFPYRIELNFDRPQLQAMQAPEQWNWTAQGLQAELLPYNLRHIILKVSGPQTLSYRDVSDGSRHMLRIVTQDVWASYVALDGKPLGRVAIDIRDMIAKLDEDANGASQLVAAASRLQLHTRPSSDAESVANEPAPPADSYDLAFQGNNIAVDMPTPPLFGPHVELATLQARITHMPQHENGSAVELLNAWRMAGGELAVSSLELKWGALSLKGNGKLSIDDQHRLQGNLSADIANYSGLIKALVDAKVVHERVADLAQAGANIFSQFQGATPGSVKLPMRIQDGTIYLGPLPIGELAPLY
ncbi:MAG: DUF2125 domain-containing protein [Hyphomonadaceae bacterium]